MAVEGPGKPMRCHTPGSLRYMAQTSMRSCLKNAGDSLRKQAEQIVHLGGDSSRSMDFAKCARASNAAVCNPSRRSRH